MSTDKIHQLVNQFHATDRDGYGPRIARFAARYGIPHRPAEKILANGGKIAPTWEADYDGLIQAVAETLDASVNATREALQANDEIPDDYGLRCRMPVRSTYPTDVEDAATLAALVVAAAGELDMTIGDALAFLKSNDEAPRSATLNSLGIGTVASLDALGVGTRGRLNRGGYRRPPADATHALPNQETADPFTRERDRREVQRREALARRQRADRETASRERLFAAYRNAFGLDEANRLMSLLEA